jgi:O-antigen/teichoic acid export membrane protein
MRLGRTTFLHFASQVLVSVAGFAATFAIAHLGGAELLGTYAVAVAIVFWFNVPTMAIGDALTKRLSEGGDGASLLATAVALNGAVAVVLGVALAIGAPIVEPFLNAPRDEPVAELVALLVVGNVGLLTVVSALNGEKKVAASGGIKAVERIVRSGIHIGAVVAGFGVAALVAGHAVASVVAVVVGAIVVRTHLGRPSVADARSLLRYARYSWLGKLKTRAFAWMDTIVLAFFVAPALIGIYEVAWNLASLFALVAVSVQSTLFPELSELGVEDDYERIHHYLEEGLVFTGVFIIPGLFGALAIGRRVLAIYSQEFTQGVEVLAVLVVARMLAAYGEQFLNAANAVDRPDVAFRINLVFVVANLVLNVSLVWLFGWLGAAVATALSAGMMLTLSYLALGSLIGYPSLPLRELAVQVLAAGAMAVAIEGLKPLAPVSTATTVLLVGAGVAIYVLLLLGGSPLVRRKFGGLTGLPLGR